MCTDIHGLLCSSTISVRCPHVVSLFYLVTQNCIKYANQVKQGTNAVETFKLCRAHSNHQLSTSTRCGRPCYRKAYTHFPRETTHLHGYISALLTSKKLYRKCWGNQCPSLLCILSVFFSFGRRILRTTEMMSWKLSSILLQGFNESITDSTKHTKRQILTLPDPVFLLGCRANSWTATAPPFILTKPPSHPQAPVCSYTNSAAFFMWGARDTSKAPCGSSSGVTSSHSPAEQSRSCQCQANTCFSLGVKDFWF